MGILGVIALGLMPVFLLGVEAIVKGAAARRRVVGTYAGWPLGCRPSIINRRSTR